MKEGGNVTVLAQLHIWHKPRTLLGSPICTVCLFAPLLPDPLPIRTSPAPPASSLLFFFSSFVVFRLVHQSKSQVSSQVRSRLLDQLGLSSALPLPCHNKHQTIILQKAQKALSSLSRTSYSIWDFPVLTVCLVYTAILRSVLS